METEQADDGWTVREQAPEPIQRPNAGKKPDVEAEQVIDRALKAGTWLVKTYGTDRAAHLAGRRIRYSGSLLGPDVKVEIHRRGAELSIKVTRKAGS